MSTLELFSRTVDNLDDRFGWGRFTHVGLQPVALGQAQNVLALLDQNWIVGC